MLYISGEYPQTGDVLICRDDRETSAEGEPNLTVGKEYIVLTLRDRFVGVLNDNGNSRRFYPDRFVLVKRGKEPEKPKMRVIRD